MNASVNNKGWNRTILKNFDEIQKDEFAWHKGYFMRNWDKQVWKKNFNELKERDNSLFMLGDLANKTILDIGCGEGMYLYTFLKMGAKEVKGIDLGPDFVAGANRLLKKYDLNGEAIVADCTTLPFGNSVFDIVYSGDVFEHITYEQKDKCLEEIFRVLKPGGIVAIKTPNLKYLKLTNFMRRIKVVFKLKNPFNVHIYHTHNNPDNEHIGLTSHAEMKELFYNNTFHEPVIAYAPIVRKGFPKFLAKALKRNLWFNASVLMSARKPIFLGLYHD